MPVAPGNTINMKDELISFEAAKLANKKGFDGCCICAYEVCDITGKESMESAINAIGDPFFNKENMIACEKNGYEAYLDPTQSLLQRWLREVHDIEVWVCTGMIGSDDSEYYYNIRHIIYPKAKRECNRYETIESLKLYSGGYTNIVPNDTYEQVLEAGLIEALKLIKTE